MTATPRRADAATRRRGDTAVVFRRVAASPRLRVRIPVSTYRIQFHAGFRFRDGRAIVSFLHDIGISDLYSSPIFKAQPGSQHGYDIVDPTALNPELGSAAEFERLVTELKKHGMGLLLDIVPNHMATGEGNRWWMDVLEKGPDSPYARFFDIEWNASFGKPLENKILLPVLGRPYGEALEAREIQIARQKGRLFVTYFDHRFPVAPATYPRGSDLRKINQDLEELGLLLDQQFYRLAYWRLASEELNYRRFFDIGELVGVRVEDEQVFEETHRFVAELVRGEAVTGLRIDHVDGLHDPIRYLNRVQHLTESEESFVVVEKVLSASERLPDEMDVEGTTGYDFLNLVNSLFVDRKGLTSLRETYRQFTGIETDFAEIIYERKKRAVARLFAGEVGRLSGLLASIAARDRAARDISMPILVHSLIDITASLPVYRTYTNSPLVSERDRAYIDTAVVRARELSGDERRVPAYEFLRRLLILDSPPDQELQEQWLRFVMQWQQLTGPAMAKGFEDTALYVWHPLLSLNEVGGDPEFQPETTGLDAFHRRNTEFLQKWPHTLNTTTTHDTKRSEGARARINVLSELPEEWKKRLRRWSSFNAAKKKGYGGQLVPDPNEEFLIYQSLLGSWPLEAGEVSDFKTRFAAYLVKAAREAKTHTSWLDPREQYEKLMQRFAAAILRKSPENRFLADFVEFHARISFFGVINALAQLALKVTSPGVPDFYQGGELWDFSMVDPDNRRPIDFGKREKMLRQLGRHPVDHRRLLSSWRDGRVKLFVTQRLLRFRSEQPELFAFGDYIPIEPIGARAENVCAFARRSGQTWSLTVVPRFCTRLVKPERFPLGGIWRDTRLPLPRGAPRAWRNIFTDQPLEGRSILLSSIFSRFPVALLEVLEDPAERDPATLLHSTPS